MSDWLTRAEDLGTNKFWPGSMGVPQGAIGGRFPEEPLKNISDNDEEVRGDRTTLAETAATLEPAAGDAIQENSHLARVKGAGNPITPGVPETPRVHDWVEAIPGN